MSNKPSKAAVALAREVAYLDVDSAARLIQEHVGELINTLGRIRSRAKSRIPHSLVASLDWIGDQALLTLKDWTP